MTTWQQADQAIGNKHADQAMLVSCASFVLLALFNFCIYLGRRSRRNSSSEDSQLTIENFGGSQDQLNAIDRFERSDRERKISNTAIGKC